MPTYNHGYLHNTGAGPGSISSAQTEILMANYSSGMQLHGRMSAVRRFFCLFVTFDLCFTILFWIICLLVDGKNIMEALREQILHYTMKSSIFDIVGCSALRFLLLILFYGIIHITHWWLVAVVTTFSCAFLIAKALLYEWKHNTSLPFEVMLTLISFLISWSEAWFIDFRVLPQEARANSILEVAGGMNAEERTIERVPPQLERVRDYLSQYTESVGNFYSPLESPAAEDESEERVLCWESSGDSEDEKRPSFGEPKGKINMIVNEDSDEDVPEIPKGLSSQEHEYILRGEEALKLSWEILNRPGWNLEKTISQNDVIFSRKGSKGYKVYKLMAIVDANPEKMYEECLSKFEAIPEWNDSITYSKLIQVVSDNVDITYQIAAETPGGVVSQRDFVGVRYWAKMNNCLAISSMSIKHPNVPVYNHLVRGENGPNLLVFGKVDGRPDQCAFQWLLDVDLKGWIPGYVLNQALLHVISNFLKSIKTYAANSQAEEQASDDALVNA